MATPNSGAFRKTSTCEPVPVSAALRHCRRFLVDLVGGRPEDRFRPVATTTHGPDVFHLLRHLTENSRLAEANLAGRPARLPHGLSALPVADLLREWERSGAAVEDALHGRRAPAGSVLLTDLLVHELDIRRAYGAQEPYCHPAVSMALDVVVGGAGAVLGRLGLPALRFETVGESWVVGEGEPEATVSAPPVELFNSLTGRRSLRQIRALRWSADPEPRLRVFAWGPFLPLPEPVG